MSWRECNYWRWWTLWRGELSLIRLYRKPSCPWRYRLLRASLEVHKPVRSGRSVIPGKRVGLRGGKATLKLVVGGGPYDFEISVSYWTHVTKVLPA